MKPRIIILSCITSLTTAILLSAGAGAQEPDIRPGLYAGGLYYNFDSERRLDNTPGIFLGGEVPLGGRWSGVLEYWDMEADQQSTPFESDVKHYRIGGNFHFNPLGEWLPYIGVGTGHLDFDPNNAAPGSDESTFDLGVGVKRLFRNNLMLRMDTRAIRGNEEDAGDFAVSLSIGYAFGAEPSPPPAPAQTAAEPEPAPEPSPEPPSDSDGDGVLDGQDNCPGTSPELAVDEDGCPILETSMRRQELMINFAFDETEIMPEYQDEIEDFAEFMREFANTSVTIEGHTDSTGPEAYNQDLSERRANAVMDVLVESGIAASRLSTMGYGESQPIADNDTPQGRARNRRIEAVVSVEVEEPVRRQE